MGNKQGIEGSNDFSDETEVEEEIPDLSQKKPSRVKEEVVKLLKDLKGTKTIEHFDKADTPKLSKTLLNYVRFTWESETEKEKAISKEIYSGMSQGGFTELVKLLWDIKSKEKVDLDSTKNRLNFSLVILIY